MHYFQFLANPIWVNLFIFVPILLWFSLKRGLNLKKSQFITLLIFSSAFGLTEAIVVIYLRKIFQLTPSSEITLGFNTVIYKIEAIREAGTIIMLASVSYASAISKKERVALFFYNFSIWDLIYYLALKIFTGWPQSLTTNDILFLIPVPWISQVWFPILISLLIILVIVIRSENKFKN